jgi:hypothetical protein
MLISDVFELTRALTNSVDLVDKLKRRDKVAVAKSEAHNGCCAALPISSEGGMEEKDVECKMRG